MEWFVVVVMLIIYKFGDAPEYTVGNVCMKSCRFNWDESYLAWLMLILLWCYIIVRRPLIVYTGIKGREELTKHLSCTHVFS